VAVEEERRNHPLSEVVEHHSHPLSEVVERRSHLLWEVLERRNHLLWVGEHRSHPLLVLERRSHPLLVLLGLCHSLRQAGLLVLRHVLPGCIRPSRLQALSLSDCKWSGIPAFQLLLLLLLPGAYSCVDLLKAFFAPKERLSFFNHEDDFAGFFFLLQDFMACLFAHLNNGFT
jgi:hypothetical protein